MPAAPRRKGPVVCPCGQRTDGNGKCPTCDSPALRAPTRRAIGVSAKIRRANHVARVDQRIGDARVRIPRGIPAAALWARTDDGRVVEIVGLSPRTAEVRDPSFPEGPAAYRWVRRGAIVPLSTGAARFIGR